MHPTLLSPYRHRRSVVHRLPALVKVSLAIACVLAIVLLPRAAWLAYAGIALALLAVAAASRVPLAALGRRLLVVESFALGIALLAFFQPHGARIALSLLARSTLCLSCMVLLTSTTRFVDLLRALRQVRLPALLQTTLALMHRCLFLLFEEMSRLRRARRSRSFATGRRHGWRISANIASQLFVRTSERAERIYLAMAARGWKT
jgi:cobalt/nickel transport system permease protein